MKKLLNNNCSASVILTTLSILSIGLAFYYNDSIFSTILWVISVPPVALTVCSFVIGYRFPVLFNGVTVALGCLYSILIATELNSLWLAASVYSVRVTVLNCSSVIIAALFVATVFVDAVNFKKNLRAVISRLLICALSFPPFFCMTLVLGHAIFIRK